MTRIRMRRVAWMMTLATVVFGLGFAGRIGVWKVLAPTQNDEISAAMPARSMTGAVLLHGGGRVPDEVRLRFIELAGGRSRARIVVVPSASGLFVDGPEADAYFLENWRRLGAASARILHTRDRDRANDPEFLKPLKEATGVWFSGGNQQRLCDTYVGTEFERQLHAVVQRGGVVGGTSAGAAIMSGLIILDGRTQAITGRGFDLVPGAVVDQHFLRRNRIGRLAQLLATHPDLIGLGVDESTALVVTGNEIRVIGDSYVVCCVPATTDRPPCTIVLKPGDRTDLAGLRQADPIVTSSTELDELLSGN